jgi:hypothetical protein
MAHGNRIVIQGDQGKGNYEEGTIKDTSSPGTIMQVQAAALDGNRRFNWIAANSGTDGLNKASAVLREDLTQGLPMTTAYVTSTHCFLYHPIPGDELNCILGEVAGTGNTYAIGDMLMQDAETGLLVPAASTPGQPWAICLEVLTQVAAANLTWVKKL